MPSYSSTLPAILKITASCELPRTCSHLAPSPAMEILGRGWLLALISAVAALGIASPANSTGADADAPAVIKLFTSQSCYSCPPADTLFGELIKSRPELIAPEFHVDYCDSLVYGSHGAHQGPFSNPDHSLRQRLYNQSSLDGQEGVFTLQLVVNGRFAAIGFKRRHIENGIEHVDRPSLDMSLTAADTLPSDASPLHIEVSADYSKVPDDSHLWLAVFDIEKSTEVVSGENHDKTLTNHHIVYELDLLTPRSGYAALRTSDSRLSLDIEVSLSDGQGCSVLFQSYAPGLIHGAAYCLESMWKRAS